MLMTQATRSSMPSRRKALAAAVSAVAAGAQTAHADQYLEEVVVTATKRAETLQEVPLAVTAFTTDDIEKRGFNNFEDYAKYVPGLSFGKREPNGTSIVFRGVAASGLQYGARASSCVYLDEQPITAAGNNPDPRLVDIERLEALRGPQGTLFGDSCQSGTLRILTNKPDETAFDSWVEASGTSVAKGDPGYDVSAMVNVPLGKQVALRVVGFRAEEGGFVDNVLHTSPGGTFTNANIAKDNVNTKDYTGGRVALRWLPTSDVTVDATAIFQKTDVAGFGDVNLDVGDLQQVRFSKENSDDTWYQLSLSTEAKLGWADATVTGTYFNRKVRYHADATDYLFYNFQNAVDRVYYPAIYDFGGDPRGGRTFNDQKAKSYTVEARLATPADSDSRWNGLVGFFFNRTNNFTYFKSDNASLPGSPAFYYLNYLAYYIRYDANGPNYRGTDQAYPLGPTRNWYWATYDQTLDQYAIFSELGFDFTDNFKVTIGGRWYWVDESRHVIIGGLQQGAKPNVLTDLVFSDERSQSDESGFLPKVNVEYHINDANMIYFTYSEGFRSGGGNAARRDSIFAGPFSSYRSDKLINYEFGAKTEWLDRRLLVNIAAYRMKWNDIQIQVEDPQQNLFQLGFVNFPEAKIDGVEVDTRWVPSEQWDLGGSMSYNDARISRTATLTASGYTFSITAIKGTRLPITPRWKGNIYAEYTFPTNLFGAEPYVRFDFSHVGDSVNSLAGVEAIIGGVPTQVQDAYDQGDLKIGLEHDMWSATFFVDNLWDERGQVFLNNRWGKQRLSITQPRTIGVSFRKRFN